jgi:hypothetical protein
MIRRPLETGARYAAHLLTFKEKNPDSMPGGRLFIRPSGFFSAEPTFF